MTYSTASRFTNICASVLSTTTQRLLSSPFFFGLASSSSNENRHSQTLSPLYRSRVPWSSSDSESEAPLWSDSISNSVFLRQVAKSSSLRGRKSKTRTLARYLAQVKGSVNVVSWPSTVVVQGTGFRMEEIGKTGWSIFSHLTVVFVSRSDCHGKRAMIILNSLRSSPASCPGSRSSTPLNF